MYEWKKIISKFRWHCISVWSLISSKSGVNRSIYIIVLISSVIHIFGMVLVVFFRICESIIFCFVVAILDLMPDVEAIHSLC